MIWIAALLAAVIIGAILYALTLYFPAPWDDDND